MNSTVTIRMTGGLSYTITLPTEKAAVMVRSISRPWLGRSADVHELNLADGTRVRINPEYVVAVEVN